MSTVMNLTQARNWLRMPIVVRHHRHRREREPVVGDRALEQQLGRALDPKAPGLDDGAVCRERADHADRLRRALQRQARKAERVLRRALQDLGGALVAVRRALAAS